MSAKSSPQGIHHVAMKVADFDRTLAFYQALGMTVDLAWGAKGPDGDGRAAMLACGRGANIEVFAGGPVGGRPEGQWMHVALETDDCDAAWDRAMAAGAKPQSDKPFNAEIKRDGQPSVHVRIAFFYGPDGEIVEFFQKLG